MAKIYIDIGHGGKDSTGTDTGTSGKYNGKTYYENEINLNIGLEVKRILESYGHIVVTQRIENVNFGSLVGSYGRADSNLINSASYCNGLDCDCMISIHNNAYSDSNANGYVLIYKAGSEASDEVQKKSRILCNNIETEISKTLPKNDVRAKLMSNGQDYYGILRLHNKVGVLIECGFMTNQSDMNRLINDYKLIAKNIADGINTYFGGTSLNITLPTNEYTTRINILETQVNNLTKEMKIKDKNIKTLTTINSQLQEKLNKVLTFDVNGDGVTDEADGVYLIKHAVDPEQFPLPRE